MKIIAKNGNQEKEGGLGGDLGIGARINLSTFFYGNREVARSIMIIRIISARKSRGGQRLGDTPFAGHRAIAVVLPKAQDNLKFCDFDIEALPRKPDPCYFATEQSDFLLRKMQSLRDCLILFRYARYP